MIELINAWSKESIEGSYLSTLLKALMDVGLVSDAEGIARDYGKVLFTIIITTLWPYIARY